MALVTTENVTVQAQGFNALPGLRQLGLMIGLAVSVALGVTVAMWSQAPNYSMLYGNLSAKDLSQVTQSLDSTGIKYKLDPGSNGILVPADQLQQARIKIAGNGLSSLPINSSRNTHMAPSDSTSNPRCSSSATTTARSSL